MTNLPRRTVRNFRHNNNMVREIFEISRFDLVLEPLVIEFRFDEKGEGQAIVQEQNGNRCTGPVRANWGMRACILP